MANASRMKAEGLKAGMPDIVMFYPANGFHGMFIEFKSKKGKVSDVQSVMIERLIAQGYYCSVCNHLEVAIQETRKYLHDTTHTA